VTWLVLVILAVLVIVVAAVAVRRSRAVDGVEQFQRQIDALSPEARRPVVDQVAQLDEQAAAGGTPPTSSTPGATGAAGAAGTVPAEPGEPPGAVAPGADTPELPGEGPPEDPQRGA
jgi:hypothetical protein